MYATLMHNILRWSDWTKIANPNQPIDVLFLPSFSTLSVGYPRDQYRRFFVFSIGILNVLTRLYQLHYHTRLENKRCVLKKTKFFLAFVFN